MAEPTKAPGLSEDWKLDKKYWYIPEGDAGLSADEFQEKILTLKEGLGINTETAPIAHPGGLLPPEAPDTTVRPTEPLSPIIPAPPSPPAPPKVEVIHREIVADLKQKIAASLAPGAVWRRTDKKIIAQLTPAPGSNYPRPEIHGRVASTDEIVQFEASIGVDYVVLPKSEKMSDDEIAFEVDGRQLIFNIREVFYQLKPQGIDFTPGLSPLERARDFRDIYLDYIENSSPSIMAPAITPAAPIELPTAPIEPHILTDLSVASEPLSPSLPTTPVDDLGAAKVSTEKIFTELFEVKGKTVDTYEQFREAAHDFDDAVVSGAQRRKVVIKDSRDGSLWQYFLVYPKEGRGFDGKPDADLKFVRYDPATGRNLDPSQSQNYKVVNKRAIAKTTFLEWYLEKGSAGVVDPAATATAVPGVEATSVPEAAPAPEPPTETKNENFIDQINLDKVKEVLSSGAVWDYLDSDTSLEIDSDVLPADLITAMEDSRSRGEAPKLIFTIESIESYLMADSDLIKVVPIVTTKDGLSINGEVLNINIFRFFVIAKPADFPVWQWQREDLRRKFKDLVDTYSNIERGKSRKGVSEPTSEKTPDDGVVVPAPEPVVTDEVAEEEDATASLPDLSAEFTDEDELPAEEISYEMTDEEILAKYKPGMQIKPNSSEFVRIWRNNKKSQNIILSPSATYTVSNVYYQDVAGSDHKILLIQVEVKTNKKGEQDYFFVANASELVKAVEVMEPSQEVGDESVEAETSPIEIPRPESEISETSSSTVPLEDNDEAVSSPVPQTDSVKGVSDVNTAPPEVVERNMIFSRSYEYALETVKEGDQYVDKIKSVTIFSPETSQVKVFEVGGRWKFELNGRDFEIEIKDIENIYTPDGERVNDLIDHQSNASEDDWLEVEVAGVGGGTTGQSVKIKETVSWWLELENASKNQA